MQLQSKYRFSGLFCRFSGALLQIYRACSRISRGSFHGFPWNSIFGAFVRDSCDDECGANTVKVQSTCGFTGLVCGLTGLFLLMGRALLQICRALFGLDLGAFVRDSCDEIAVQIESI